MSDTNTETASKVFCGTAQILVKAEVKLLFDLGFITFLQRQII